MDGATVIALSSLLVGVAGLAIKIYSTFFDPGSSGAEIKKADQNEK